MGASGIVFGTPNHGLLKDILDVVIYMTEGDRKFNFTVKVCSLAHC